MLREEGLVHEGAETVFAFLQSPHVSVRPTTAHARGACAQGQFTTTDKEAKRTMFQMTTQSGYNIEQRNQMRMWEEEACVACA